MEWTSIIKHRQPLEKTMRALSQGKLTVGFIGGSITDQRAGWNWPEPVTSWFAEQYPTARILVENAAIGATGSNLAVFRAERDLINRNCDLVFIEFAVNDYYVATEKRNASREGLIRKLLAHGNCDLVLTYTYRREMYLDMSENKVPHSIDEFETLAKHYGISSVWMGKHAFEEVKKGRMRFEEWLPDGLHPQFRGSLSYAQSVTHFLEEALSEKNAFSAKTGPVPALFHYNWENATILPFDQVQLEGPWKFRRSTEMVWMDMMLETAAIGARLRFAFEARELYLAFSFGKNSSEYRYRVDGGEWIQTSRDRPSWCGNSGWFTSDKVFESPASSLHQFELEVIHGDTPECGGTNFALAFIGIVQ